MKRKPARTAKAKPEQSNVGAANRVAEVRDGALLPCLASTARGCVLSVTVVPNGQRTEVLGFHDRSLKLRLAAPPVDGRSNELLVAWLAAQWGLPRKALNITAGEHARRKRIEVEAPPSILLRWLDGLALCAH